MVYTSEQQFNIHNLGQQMALPELLDPTVLRAARQIYQVYYSVHPNTPQPPLGVAIHPRTQRGQLIFTRKPILLPQECFVPFNQLDE